MKFGQLIEYNIGNIFTKNHPQNTVEKLAPDLIIENQSWVYLWINSLKCYNSFLLHVQADAYQHILKLMSWSLAFILYKGFLKKQKEVWN